MFEIIKNDDGKHELIHWEINDVYVMVKEAQSNSADEEFWQDITDSTLEAAETVAGVDHTEKTDWLGNYNWTLMSAF